MFASTSPRDHGRIYDDQPRKKQCRFHTRNRSAPGLARRALTPYSVCTHPLHIMVSARWPHILERRDPGLARPASTNLLTNAPCMECRSGQQRNFLLLRCAAMASRLWRFSDGPSPLFCDRTRGWFCRHMDHGTAVLQFWNSSTGHLSLLPAEPRDGLADERCEMLWALDICHSIYGIHVCSNCSRQKDRPWRAVAHLSCSCASCGQPHAGNSL